MTKIVKYIDTKTTDYTVVQYTFDIYTKANCLMKYYGYNTNVFEANEILHGIYLGSINSVYDIERLKKLGITHIISVIGGFVPPYPEDFNYLVINALDTPYTELLDNFETSNDFIDDAIMDNSKILIHCQAGRSRSATILIAYFMRKYNISYMKAYEFVKSKRSIINPNKEFVEALKEYQITLNILN